MPLARRLFRTTNARRARNPNSTLTKAHRAQSLLRLSANSAPLVRQATNNLVLLALLACKALNRRGRPFPPGTRKVGSVHNPIEPHPRLGISAKLCLAHQSRKDVRKALARQRKIIRLTITGDDNGLRFAFTLRVIARQGQREPNRPP